MFRPIAWALAALTLVLLAACSNQAADKGSPKSKNAEPRVKKLQISDKKVGTGDEVANGDTVWVTYVGKFGTGEVFDSNDKADSEPYAFKVGARRVLPGWEQGLVGMKVGGERKLAIPSDLAYGKFGMPPKMPPDSDLYFDIVLHDVVKQGKENELRIEDLKVGNGPDLRMGDTAVVHSKVKLVNGKLIDSSYARKKPDEFKVGYKFNLSGVNTGLLGMRPGGKRRLRLTPDISWGEGGGPFVPANSIMIVELELVKIKGRP